MAPLTGSLTQRLPSAMASRSSGLIGGRASTASADIGRGAGQPPSVAAGAAGAVALGVTGPAVAVGTAAVEAGDVVETGPAPVLVDEAVEEQAATTAAPA